MDTCLKNLQAQKIYSEAETNSKNNWRNSQSIPLKI